MTDTTDDTDNEAMEYARRFALQHGLVTEEELAKRNADMLDAMLKVVVASKRHVEVMVDQGLSVTRNIDRPDFVLRFATVTILVSNASMANLSALHVAAYMELMKMFPGGWTRSVSVGTL